MYVCIFVFKGSSTSQGIGTRNEMMMDDYDGQMVCGDLVGLKLPDIRLTGEEKPRKNLTQETCPNWGSNPGPLHDKRACYHLFHSGGPMLSTSLVFHIPQSGGVVRGAVQLNMILFPLKAYSLWNLCKAAESLRWRCSTRQCWLNCRSALKRNGHNFIGPQFCSLWLLLIPMTKDKAPGHSIWDLWRSAEEKWGDSQGPASCVRGMAAML